MRLFVDSDMLGEWLDQGIHRFNAPLITAIEMWYYLHWPPNHVVIWSAWGADHAETWADRAWPHGLHYFYNAKNIGLPVAGDIVVDDDDVKTAGQLMTAEQFIEMMRDVPAEA